MLNQLIEPLRAAVNTGVIYNARYVETKDSLNRLLDKERIALRPDFRAMYSDWWSAPKLAQEADDTPYSVHGVKAWAKRVAKAGKLVPDSYHAFVARWLPVAELLEQVKPLVVKGRAPSTGERKTPPRTIENTGTCGICGANVKLDAQGRLVAHGFTLEGYGRSGNCFGVRYQPHEISPLACEKFAERCRADAVAYRERITRLQATSEPLPRPSIRGRQQTWSTPEDSDYQAVKSGLIREANYRAEQAEYYDRYYTEKVANWQASMLPGQTR